MMDVTAEYVNTQVRAATARNLLQLGFTQSNVTCVDVLTDITTLYLKKVASRVQKCAEHAGRDRPSIKDVGTAFAMMKISERELYEYMRQVRSIEEYDPAPMFPVRTAKPKPINIHCPTEKIDPLRIEEQNHSTNDRATSALKPLPDFSEATAYSLGFVKPTTYRSSTLLRTNVKRATPYSPPAVRTQQKTSKKHNCSSASRKGRKTCIVTENPGQPLYDIPLEQPVLHNPEPQTATYGVKQNKKRKQVTAKGRLKKKAHDHNANELPRESEMSTSVSEEMSTTVVKQVELQSAQASEKLTSTVPRATEESENGSGEVAQAQQKVPPIRIRFTANGPYIVNDSSSNLRLAVVVQRSRLFAFLLQSRRISVNAKAKKVLTADDSSRIQPCGTSGTLRCAVRRQESSRFKKIVPSFPYLASDLMRNSYAVLTACMTGRAFPIAPNSQEANEAPEVTADDFSSKSIVNEVIWRGLFSQHGIIPKSNEVVLQPRSKRFGNQEALDATSSDCGTLSNEEREEDDYEWNP